MDPGSRTLRALGRDPLTILNILWVSACASFACFTGMTDNVIERIQMNRIQRLSPLVANQIAAGEVIERPASVVKELLENSLDAGAKNILIQIENAGARLISITDDGCGIHKDDLILAIAPHATSKIHSSDDLHQIVTLGFRGEALASISSISKLSICTRTKEDEHAWQLVSEGNSEHEIKPAAHPVGTTIQVRDLFFNTPARRRFLRSDKTEFSHIEEIVKRIALSQFDIAITLQHENKVVLKVAKALDDKQKHKRIASIYGEAFLRQSFYLDFEATGLRLSGWISQKEFSRNQTDLQFFYINGRNVRDRIVMHAIKKAYTDFLGVDKHPAYVLFLEIDPRNVDVNVHPTKHEVRFHEVRLVHDFIFQKIHSALTSSGQNQNIYFGQNEIEYFRTKKTNEVSENFKNYEVISTAQSNLVEERFGKIIGQYSHFVLTTQNQNLFFIDLRVLQQYLAYKKYQKPIRSKLLLIPELLILNKEQMDHFLKKQMTIESLGFHFNQLSDQKIIIREQPEFLAHINYQEWQVVILNCINEDNDFLIKEICKTAFKKENPMSLLELDKLFQQAAELTDTELSQHKIFYSLSYQDVINFFQD